MTPAQLASALAERIDAVMPQLFPQAKRNGAYWSIGSVEGEAGASLYVHRDGQKIGKWCDAAAGQYGDLLDLVQMTKRLDLHGACDWARAFVGTSEPRSPARHDAPEDDGSRNAVKRWSEGKCGDETLAAVYLRGRKITVPLGPCVRFHRAMFYKPSEVVLPAAMFAVSGPERRVHAVQRVYLRPDGSGKANVSQPKMTLGPLRNGAVRFAPATAELGLAEGPETALSAMQLHRMPTWAAVGSRMDAVAIPETVTRLVIFADNGKPGVRAAERAAEAHRRVGRVVEIAYPAAQFKDWNDVLTGATTQSDEAIG